MRAVSAVLAVLFLFAAVVNLNDPDPWGWVALYGAAALAAGWRAFRPPGPPALVPVGVAVAAAVWAATLAPHVMGHVGFGELWSAWEMKNTRVEEGREFGGLCLIALGSLAVAFGPRRRGR